MQKSQPLEELEKRVSAKINSEKVYARKAPSTLKDLFQLEQHEGGQERPEIELPRTEE
jgi:hypothetical protein